MRRPKLEAFTGIIDQILIDDRERPRKQRHTAQRIFDRLHDEYGFTGGYTIVKDYVREKKLGGQEMFVPLTHPPGDAQADFGEALVVINGVQRKAHFLVVDLPHSDDAFVKAFPAETTEAFCEGHNAAFRYFGGVPRSIVYDNTKLRWRGSWETAHARGPVCSPSCSRIICSPTVSGGRARAMIKARWRDWWAMRGATSWCRFRAFQLEAFNEHLEAKCRKNRERRLRRHSETIGERFERDRQAFLPLPAVGYDACDKRTTRVTSLSLVRYRTNDYSVPTATVTAKYC